MSTARSTSPLLELLTNPTLLAILAVLAAYVGLAMSFHLQNAMAYLLGLPIGAILWIRLSEWYRHYVNLGRGQSD